MIESLLHFNNPDDLAKDEIEGVSWTVNGTVSSSQDGRFGNCLSLNGNGYLQNNTIDLSLDKEWTLDMWIYASNFGGDQPSVSIKCPTKRTIKQGMYASNHFFFIATKSNSWVSYDLGLPNSEWFHFALVNSSSLLYGFVNGIKKFEHDNTNINLLNSPDVLIGYLYNYNKFIGLIDEFRISNKALWTSDFTPPATESEYHQATKWTKLADNWESLTDDEKVALFQNVTTDIPSITDLQAMGKVKIVSLTKNKSIVGVTLTGVPKRTVVIPKDIFSVDSFATINSMTLNCNLSGAGQVGVAVTKDLKTYYIFDNEWKVIDVNNDAFMTPTQLSALTSAEWKTLLGDDTTLGIAYSLELSDTTDKADIDSLTLNVDVKGTWTKAIYGDEYTYEYFNKSLQVDILKDGSYKVNYPLIGKVDDKPNPDDKDVPMYGVTFDGTNSLGVRTYDATTLNFTPSTATVAGIDDFKDLAPFNVKECCRVYSSSGTQYYYKENYSDSEWQQIREGKHSTITGDIMIEIPSFYYSRPSENEFIVAPKAKDGFLPSPAHFRNGKLLDKIWITKYNINTNYESKSKTSPRTRTDMNTFRSNLRNKEMYMLDYPTWCSLVILALVKYANMDVQASVAKGYNSGSSAYASGNADNVLGLDGSNTSVGSNEASLCMGIENLYGNIWKFIDGAYVVELYLYLGDILNITTDPTEEDLATYTKLATKIASGENSWIKTISYDTSAPYCIYPTSAGTPSPSDDVMDVPNSIMTCCLVGGSSWNAFGTGLFAFNVAKRPGHSEVNCGAVGCCFS